MCTWAFFFIGNSEITRRILDLSKPPVLSQHKMEIFGEQYFIWLVVWNIFYFPIYWVSNHPNWLIFFRGVQTTNQFIIIPLKWRTSPKKTVFYVCFRDLPMRTSQRVSQEVWRHLATWRCSCWRRIIGLTCGTRWFFPPVMSVGL